MKIAVVGSKKFNDYEKFKEMDNDLWIIILQKKSFLKMSDDFDRILENERRKDGQHRESL